MKSVSILAVTISTVICWGSVTGYTQGESRKNAVAGSAKVNPNHLTSLTNRFAWEAVPWHQGETTKVKRPVERPQRAADIGSTRPIVHDLKVTEKGRDHKVWEYKSVAPGPDGQPVERTASYTEIGTGMHYLKDDKYVEADPEIRSGFINHFDVSTLYLYFYDGFVKS